MAYPHSDYVYEDYGKYSGYDDRSRHQDQVSSGRRPEGYSADIQHSLEAVQKFVSERMATKCSFCESDITASFSVKEWMRRWSLGAKRNSESSCAIISAAPCPNCEILTCLGCGKEPRRARPARRVQDFLLDWCCHDGMLFGIWVLLARFDQVELIMQSSGSSGAGAKHESSVRPRSDKKNTGDSRGIGYADKSGRSNPFASLFYDGPGSPPIALSRPIDFKVADEKTDSVTQMILELVAEMIPAPKDTSRASELRALFQLSLIMDKAAELLRNDSLDEVTKREDLYLAVFRFVRKLAVHPALKSLVQEPRYPKQQTAGLQVLSQSAGVNKRKHETLLILGDDTISSLDERLKPLARQSDVVLTSTDRQGLTGWEGKSVVGLCQEITMTYAAISSNKPQTGPSRSSPKEEWEAYHKENCVTRDDSVLQAINLEFSRHAAAMTHSNPGRMKRLVTEVANMATSLPMGIFVKVSESRPDVMKCLIIGPPDSPYGYGVFDFDLLCPSSYPLKPPVVLSRTTIDRPRFSPNLHPDGKVCLSLLGTWMEGDAAAQWQPGKSTILSVLISIQAMIFTEDPLRNEPAFTGKVGEEVEQKARGYIKFIQPLTVRYAMLDWLQKDRLRYGIWSDVVRAHFSFNGKSILENVERWSQTNPALQNWDSRASSSHVRHPFRSTTGRNLLQDLRESLSQLRRNV